MRQPGANHAPRASVTQVNLSVQILSTFLRIRADPNMQIFWISVTLVLLDTFSIIIIIIIIITNNYYYLSDNDSKGVLSLSDDVMEQLQEKHPEPQEARLRSLLFGPI